MFPLTPPKNDWAIQPEVVIRAWSSLSEKLTYHFIIFSHKLSSYSRNWIYMQSVVATCSSSTRFSVYVSAQGVCWTQECLNSHFHLLNFLHSFWYHIFYYRNLQKLSWIKGIAGLTGGNSLRHQGPVKKWGVWPTIFHALTLRKETFTSLQSNIRYVEN